jgi:hypothetical protein
VGSSPSGSASMPKRTLLPSTAGPSAGPATSPPTLFTDGGVVVVGAVPVFDDELLQDASRSAPHSATTIAVERKRGACGVDERPLDIRMTPMCAVAAGATPRRPRPDIGYHDRPIHRQHPAGSAGYGPLDPGDPGPPGGAPMPRQPPVGATASVKVTRASSKVDKRAATVISHVPAMARSRLSSRMK